MREALNESMGRVTVTDGTAKIEFVRYLQHSRDRVWGAITDQEQLARWYLCKVKVVGGPGGRIDLWFGKDHVYGTILAWEPPGVLEYEWNIDPRVGLPEGERAIVRWELLENGKGTTVRLSHFNLSRKTALGLSEGLEPMSSNHILLDRLMLFLYSKPLNIGPDLISLIREEYRKLIEFQ